MKKTRALKAVLIAVMMAGSIFGAFAGAGCMRNKPPSIDSFLDADDIVEIDKNRTQINIQVFNGGTGIAWINNLANVFNKTQSKYQIYPVGRKADVSDIANDFRAGRSVYAAAFNPSPAWKNYIQEGLLENLSSLADRKPDGAQGKTIKEKIAFDGWDSASAFRGEGMYALPYVMSMGGGLVYDHARWTHYNDDDSSLSWLKLATASDKAKADADLAFLGTGIYAEVVGSKLIYRGKETRYYKDGDTILYPGSDGKYGTYDDGWPETLEEFDALINKISNKNVSPFIMFGDYSYGYQTPMAKSLFAQFVGPKAAETFFSFGAVPGTVKMHDGSSLYIDNSNGYQVYNMDGFSPMIEFLDNYLNKTYYQHPAMVNNPTHTQAQDLFVTGYTAKIPNNKESAFLVENAWWENESRVIMGEMETSFPGHNFGFGKHDYRYMLMPSLPDQHGINGDGKGRFFCDADTGAFVVRKHKPEEQEQLSVLLNFLETTLSNDALQAFTIKTGLLRPYNYTFTEENLAKVPKFGRSIYDMYFDTENVYAIASSPLSLTGSAGYMFARYAVPTSHGVPTRVNNTVVPHPMQYLASNRNNANRINDYLNGVRMVLNESQWSEIQSELVSTNMW